MIMAGWRPPKRCRGLNVNCFNVAQSLLLSQMRFGVKPRKRGKLGFSFQFLLRGEAAMSDSEFSCLHSSRVRVDCRAVETAVIFVQCQRSASALISAARRMN